MKLKLFFAIIILIYSNSIFSQSNKNILISGRILDKDKLSLPGANISIDSLNIGTVSDVNGYYIIKNVPEGKHTLKVSYLGYKAYTTQITVGINNKNIFNIKLKTDNISLTEVIIGAYQKGQAKALNHQRAKNNISNIIASEQTGKFPDSNIGDALKRIPSVNVTYDQGEARFFQIRGTSSRLNSVLLDGGRIPSAEGETRAVQLDLIPTDMIQTIEVNKAITADMDADAIGGAINLITKSAPNDMRISTSFASGYNMMSEKPTWNGTALFGNRYFDDNLGLIISASYFDNNLGSDNIEAEWDLDNNDKNYLKEFQIRKYEIQRIRRSVSADLDYNIGQHSKIALKTILNHRDDYENRFRLTIKDIETIDGKTTAEIRRQTKGGSSDIKNKRLERQIVLTTKLLGTHNLGFANINWYADYSKASEKRPDERYITYRQKEVSVSPNINNLSKPKIFVNDNLSKDLNSNWKLKELTQEDQFTYEEDFKGSLNIAIPINQESKLKFGTKYSRKFKKRDNNFNNYEALNQSSFNTNTFENIINKTKKDFEAGNYQSGNFISNKYLGELNLNNSKQFKVTSDPSEFAAKNYKAKEQITAGYLQYEQNITDKFSVIAGFRVENTYIDYTGNKYIADGDNNKITPLNANDNYTNFLPNFHAKYEFNRKSILRFAYTNTIARPNYYHLVPFQEQKIDDNEITIGNPDLKPTKSLNFDLMYERYFSSIGIFSAGVFYKGLKDIIIKQNKDDFTFEGHKWDDYVKPLNAGNGIIYGAEFSLNKKLNFLPSFLSNLVLYTNYTYTESEVDKVLVEGRDNLEMPGTAKHTANASLAYETKAFSLRTSVNYSSEYLDEDNVGESKFYDVYYDKTLYIDVNASYKLKNGFSFFAEANNITNQPLSYYQGTKDKIYQSEYYSLKFAFGLRFDF